MNSVIAGLFFPSLTCRDYTLKEKFNLWRGKSQSGVYPLWDAMISINLTQQANKINIPVYFFHGIFDYTVLYPLAKNYFEVLPIGKVREYACNFREKIYIKTG